MVGVEGDCHCGRFGEYNVLYFMIKDAASSSGPSIDTNTKKESPAECNEGKNVVL